MAFAFRVNDYGCFENKLLDTLNTYIISKQTLTPKFLDIQCCDPEHSITIYQNMKDIDVNIDSVGTQLTPFVVQLVYKNIAMTFEKTSNGVFSTILIRDRQNPLRQPVIFNPSMVVISN